MIKKFIDFKLLESNQEAQHIIIKESVLELIDNGYLKNELIYFEEGKEDEDKKLRYRFDVNIEENNISAFKNLFEGLEISTKRLDLECFFRGDDIYFILNINSNLSKFIYDSSVTYEYGIGHVISEDLYIHISEEFKLVDDYTILFDGYIHEEKDSNLDLIIEDLKKYGSFDIDIEENPEARFLRNIKFKMKLY